jgi:primary-amine oxidase
VNQIGYRDDGHLRPVIHKLALNEIFVPYGIPDITWTWRAATDLGDYNAGQFTQSLAKNVDVPENAVFFDVALPSDTGSIGGAFELPHFAALYERDSLNALWDRTDPVSFLRDARLGRELVLTTSIWIGNYTYSVAYIFRQDGGLDVRAGSTGTTLNRGVSSVEEGNQFGTTVFPNIAAPSHQHFFNFRIDFDVDGTLNRVVEENTEPVQSDFGNAFVERETVLASEGFRDVNPETDRAWVIESTTRENALGEPTAYELEPQETARPYASPSYPPLQKAAFAKHQLWLTRYREGEQYVRGSYPNQGEIGEGIADYITPAEDIRGRDIVVWYTAGMTHHPRTEEYPVMPTEFVGFSLEPVGFFNEDPALDVPSQD